MITVDILDDHNMVVEGFKRIIAESGSVSVVATYNCIAVCREGLVARQPDVLLLDVNLPDGSGVDFCAEVKKAYPDLKILVLTSFREVNIAKRVLAVGASGYVLKNSLGEELIAGIETVAAGGRFLCEEMGVLLRKKRNDEAVWLTGREKEVLRLIAEGYSNLEIAERIHLSNDTIKGYRKNLLQKFGAKNTAAMVKSAIEQQLI